MKTVHEIDSKAMLSEILIAIGKLFVTDKSMHNLLHANVHLES